MQVTHGRGTLGADGVKIIQLNSTAVGTCHVPIAVAGGADPDTSLSPGFITSLWNLIELWTHTDH